MPSSNAMGMRWSLAGLACMVSLAAAQGLPGTKVLNVWGAVVVQTYGERTPLLAPGDKTLTPTGAQQLYEAGSFYRQRYINGLANTISGLPDQQINNSHLEVWTDASPWNQQSAQAFFSGFYPPSTQPNSVGQNSTDSALADGTTAVNPLNGTQYPIINTPSMQDPESFLFNGVSQCTAYYQEVNQWLESPTIQQRNASTLQFYSGLADVVGTSSASILNYGNAYEIWDLLSYQVKHNQQVASAYGTNVTQAGQLADSYVASTVANTSSSILTIAGRSIAQPIIDALGENIASGGSKAKLSTFFVGYEPFVSFAAMLGATPKTNNSVSVPNLGSSFVIELYSEEVVQAQGNKMNSYPSNLSDLYVRFYMRQGTGANLTNPSLSAIRSASVGDGGVQYLDFYKALESVLIGDPATWCTICSSPASFCPLFAGNNFTLGTVPVITGSHGVNPVVAGVIGAMVTLAVLFLALLVSMLALGFRIRRESSGLLAGKPKVSGWSPGSSENRKRRLSGLGGFKGDEKLASDIDLPRGALVAGQSNAHAHQRTSSWELKNKTPTGLNKDSPEAVSPGTGIRVISNDDDEDDLSNMKAVETRESV